MSKSKNKSTVNTKSNLITLQAKTQQAELERLQRVTGLPFDQLPSSLIKKLGGLELAKEDGEELIFRALHLWDEEEAG